MNALPRNHGFGRVLLAALRLAFLFVVFCYLLLQIGLAARHLIESAPLQFQPHQFQPHQFQPQSHATNPTYPASLAGINVSLQPYADADQRRAALDNLRAAGFGWVRQRADWGLLEPTPGQYAWDEMDEIVADVAAARLQLVVVLDGSPAWARAPQDRAPTDNPFAPPANNADFARFAANFAQRYGETVRFYQIWDEPNIAPHWGNRLIEPVAYARLLAASVPGLRAADGDAVILLAALAPTRDRGHTAIDEPTYLRRLYAAGADAYFDGVAAQPFGFGLSPTDSRSRADLLNFQRLGLLRQEMIAAGDGDTPIWAVRYGWNRSTNQIWQTVIPDVQARYVQQANELARGWHWLAGLGWAVDRPDRPADDPQWGFALYTADGAPLPLWDTFAQVNRSTEVAERSGDGTTLAWLILYSAALAGVLWRGWSAAQVAQVNRWPGGFAGLPLAVRLACWLGLATVYYFATWPPLIGLCWLIAALFLAAEPGLVLVLVGLLLPFHYQHKELHLVGAVLTVPPAYALLVCGLPGLVRGWRRKMPPHWHGLGFADWLAVGWLAASLGSAGMGWHWVGTPAGLGGLVIGPLLFYALGRSAANSPLLVARAGSGLMGGGLLAGLVGLFLWWNGESTWVDGVHRLIGLTFSPNQTALLLERTLFVWLGVALVGQGGNQSRLRAALPWVWRLAIGAGASVIVCALWLTGSRGAILLGVPAGGAILLAQQPTARRWLKQRWRIVLAAGVVVLVGATVLLGDRLLNGGTVIQRIYIWQGAVAMWRAFPWLGTGPGGFFWHYPAFMVDAAASEPNLLHPHTIWLEMATGWGVPGLVWLLAFVYWLAAYVANPAKRLSGVEVGLLAGLVAGLAHGQVDTFGMLPELAAWNWLAIGLLSAGSPRAVV